MLQLKFQEGGRPLANDDLEILQQEVLAAVHATLTELPACILSGCQQYWLGVTNQHSLASGYVWLAGEIMRFDGSGAIELPAELVAGPVVDSDMRAYETGGSKACLTERQAIIRPLSTEAVPKIVLLPAGQPHTYWKLAQARFRAIGEVQQLTKIVREHYDDTGKGIAGTEAHGWGLCNGQDGRADLRRRFIIGLDEADAEYSPIGKTGGAATHQLTVAELPSHSFSMSIPFAANPGQGDDGNNRVTLDTGKKTNVNSSSVGGDMPHNNMPPYYVLVAREWIGF